MRPRWVTLTAGMLVTGQGRSGELWGGTRSFKQKRGFLLLYLPWEVPQLGESIVHSDSSLTVCIRLKFAWVLIIELLAMHPEVEGLFEILRKVYIRQQYRVPDGVKLWTLRKQRCPVSLPEITQGYLTLKRYLQSSSLTFRKYRFYLHSCNNSFLETTRLFWMSRVPWESYDLLVYHSED